MNDKERATKDLLDRLNSISVYLPEEFGHEGCEALSFNLLPQTDEVEIVFYRNRKLETVETMRIMMADAMCEVYEIEAGIKELDLAPLKDGSLAIVAK
jgi:hypothetical protein